MIPYTCRKTEFSTIYYYYIYYKVHDDFQILTRLFLTLKMDYIFFFLVSDGCLFCLVNSFSFRNLVLVKIKRQQESIFIEPTDFIGLLKFSEIRYKVYHVLHLKPYKNI